MTDEEMRIAIAEACGWKPANEAEIIRRDSRCALIKGPWWRNKEEHTIATIDSLPDYLNDLNACAEFEASLTDAQYVQWALMLNKLWLRDNPYPIPNRVGIYRSASATARQRAEAFLRTLNLWKD